MTADEFLDAINALNRTSDKPPGMIDAYLTGAVSGMLTDQQRHLIYTRVKRYAEGK